MTVRNYSKRSYYWFFIIFISTFLSAYTLVVNAQQIGRDIERGIEIAGRTVGTTIGSTMRGDSQQETQRRVNDLFEPRTVREPSVGSEFVSLEPDGSSIYYDGDDSDGSLFERVRPSENRDTNRGGGSAQACLTNIRVSPPHPQAGDEVTVSWRENSSAFSRVDNLRQYYFIDPITYQSYLNTSNVATYGSNTQFYSNRLPFLDSISDSLRVNRTDSVTFTAEPGINTYTLMTRRGDISQSFTTGRGDPRFTFCPSYKITVEVPGISLQSFIQRPSAGVPVGDVRPGHRTLDSGDTRNYGLVWYGSGIDFSTCEGTGPSFTATPAGNVRDMNIALGTQNTEFDLALPSDGAQHLYTISCQSNSGETVTDAVTISRGAGSGTFTLVTPSLQDITVRPSETINSLDFNYRNNGTTNPTNLNADISINGMANRSYTLSNAPPVGETRTLTRAIVPWTAPDTDTTVPYEVCLDHPNQTAEQCATANIIVTGTPIPRTVVDVSNQDITIPVNTLLRDVDFTYLNQGNVTAQNSPLLVRIGNTGYRSTVIRAPIQAGDTRDITGLPLNPPGWRTPATARTLPWSVCVGNAQMSGGANCTYALIHVVDNPSEVTQCNDGRDNADPEDTLADAQDPGCWTNPSDPGTYDPTDNDETNTSGGSRQCSDGIDNADPEDTLIDAADPGCWTDPSDPSTYNPNDNNETYVPSGPPECNDGVDNSDPEDTLADEDDPGCWTDSTNPATYNPSDDDERNYVCSDGLDNDGDGRIDYPRDRGCTSPTDTDETNPAPQCDDSLDNDSDGLTDYPADPGCTSANDDDETNTMGDPTIDADQTFVRSGEDVTISWDPAGNPGCSLSAQLSTASPVTTVGSESVTISNTSIFTISCTSGREDSVTVRVVPSIFET